MGLSSSKSKTTNDPWAPAQPYILKNLQQQDTAFNENQPQLQQFANDQRATYGRLAPGAEQGIMGAQGVVNDTLSGKYLSGNPYLDKVLATTRSNITNDVNSEFAGAGRYGSGAYTGVLAQKLAEAENSARYGDYANERANQLNAVGQAQGLMGGAQGLLNNAAELPWIGIQAANGAVRQASNGYGTTTSKQSTPWGPVLAQAASNAAGAFAASDRRLKMDITQIGEEPDGLGVYTYRYVTDDPDGPLRTGVMADEVAKLRPDALGPQRNGFATVNYGAL